MLSTWSCVLPASRTFDDSTGVWSETPPVTVYDGPGRLHSATNQAQRDIEAGATVTLHGTLLSMPVGAAPGLKIDHVLECTAAVDEPGLVGVKVRVKALPTGEQATADRYGVEREVPQ